MKVDIYSNRRDYTTITRWYEERGLDPIEARFLGQGFIVKDVAAVFLYPTGTPICFLENLISNKNIAKEQRNEAIDMLIDSVLKIARSYGVEQVTSVSKISAVTQRALTKHGFKTNDDSYKLLIKQLP